MAPPEASQGRRTAHHSTEQLSQRSDGDADLISMEEIIEAFKVLDREGKDFISDAELHHVMTNLNGEITEGGSGPRESEISVRGIIEVLEGYSRHVDGMSPQEVCSILGWHAHAA